MRNTKPRLSSHSNSKRSSALFCSLLVAIVALSGCAGEQRTTGTVFNDQHLEYEVISKLRSDPNFDENDHIKVEVFQGIVLLAGETTSEEKRLLATRLAEEPKLSLRVVNDLKIGRRSGFGGKLDNSWLTTKVNSVLLAENPVKGYEGRRIKVISSQNTVYLMGFVTRDEGEKVAEVVRNIGGVEKVVKVFDYTD